MKISMSILFAMDTAAMGLRVPVIHAGGELPNCVHVQPNPFFILMFKDLSRNPRTLGFHGSDTYAFNLGKAFISGRSMDGTFHLIAQ
jgi:hypothetical protein